MMEQVILVNKSDEQIGLMGKLEAHEKGCLHRAFSVFVFNDKNELLLQKRARNKYHSGGLWTNTCCSHPRENETIVAAGKRRMQEEMGFICEMEPVFSFIYEALLDNDLTEHELDHVLIGTYNQNPTPNPEEVEDWKYIDLETLSSDMEVNPEEYTVWFKLVFEQVKNRFNQA